MPLGTRKARALWVVAWLGLALSPDVRAADGQDGRALFDAGVKAYQQGRYRAAATAFQEAFELTRRPGLLFSLGQALRRSYEQTRDPTELQEAIRYYERYLDAQHEGEHRSEAVSWLEQLSSLPAAKSPPAAAAAVERARAQLVVAVNVPSAKLSLDGRPVPTLPHAAQVLPGKHQILVTAVGYATERREISIAAGAVVSLNIELRALTSRVAVTGEHGAELFIDDVRAGILPSPPVQLAPGQHSVEVRAPGRVTLRQTVQLSAEDSLRLRLFAPATTRRTASWALIGTGTAALLASGVLGYFALQQESKARALQSQPGAGPAFDDSVAKRNGLRLAAAISGGVGVAATLSGVISIATEGFGPVRSVAAPAPGRHQASFYGVQLSGAL